MPETISLNAYLTRLDNLLAANATDEVIHHCRHILQHAPKNAATHRTLGRALLYSARWDAARAIFLRVLGVFPDDYVAHIALSEIYDHQERGTDAIWHLERAYEQEPNNGELIDGLRAQYRKYHRADQARIQLTAAALARQYTHGGLHDQAIDLLRSSLERMPARLDLKALLIDALWENDQHIEAAEHALDLLRVLPDCLVANRVLSQLWLQEDRPSDAQRFLNRLEAVDPYLALTLVEGRPADDRVFTLDLLDYRRVAQTELATAEPDWLAELGGRPDAASATGVFTEDGEADAVPAFEGDWTDYVPENERPVATTTDDGEHTGFTDDLPSLTTTDHLKLRGLTSGPESARERLSDSDLLFDDKVEGFERAEHISETHARDLRSATSMHASIFGGKAPDSDELPEWVVSPTGDDEVELPPGSDLASAADPLAWLRGTGIDVNDAITQRSLRPDEHPAVFSSEPVDPLAWVHDSEIDFGAHSTPPAPEDDIDAYAWMTGSDLDLGFDFDTVARAPSPAIETEDSGSAEPDDSDPLAWMRDMRMSPGAETAVDTPFDTPFDTPPDVDFRAPFDFDEPRTEASGDIEPTDDATENPGGSARGSTRLAWVRATAPDDPANGSPDHPANSLSDALAPTDASDVDWMRASLIGSATDDTDIGDDDSVVANDDWDGDFLHTNPADNEDPFAWMRESGIDLGDLDDPDEGSAPSPTLFGDDDEDNDPLAWLRASGIEYDEDAQPDKAWTDPYDTADQTPIHDPASDPLGWMEGYEVGADPDLADSLVAQSVNTGQPDTAGAPTDDDTGTAPDTLEAFDQDDPFAWLRDGSLDTDDTMDAEASAAAGATEADDLALDDSFEWLRNLDLGDLIRDDVNPKHGGQVTIPLNEDDEPRPPLRAVPPPDDSGPRASLTPRTDGPPVGTMSVGSAALMMATGGPVGWHAPVEDAAAQPTLVPRPHPSRLQTRPLRPFDSVSPLEQPDRQPSDHENNPERDPTADRNGAPARSEETGILEAAAQRAPDATAAASDADRLSEVTVDDATEITTGTRISWIDEGAHATAPVVENAEMADRQEDMNDKNKKEASDSQTPRSHEPNDDANNPESSHLSDMTSDNDHAEARRDAIPDWMAELSFEEDSAPMQAGDGQMSDEPTDDLTSDPFNTPPVEPTIEPTADVPDWLAALGPQYTQPESLSAPAQPPDIEADDLPQPPEGVRDEHGFEWLSGMDNGTSAPDDALPAASNAPASADEFQWEPSATPESDVPDWLAALGQPAGNAATAPDAFETEDEDVDAGFEWMNELPDDETIEPANMPDWLAALEPQATAQPSADSGSLDTPDWLSELEQPGSQASDAEADPWIMDLSQPPASNAVDVPETISDAVGEDMAETAMPDWLAEMEPAEMHSDAYAELPSAPEAASAFELTETPLASEVAHEPASNAPDWLNAMVPGVDLDYEVEEDAPIERDYIDAAPHRERELADERAAAIQASRRDFDWLSDLVDEETGQATPLSAPAALSDATRAPSEAVAATTKQPRFVFSKPPAWLRGKQASAPAAVKGSNADWTSAGNAPNDDFDVPDWMK